MEKKSTPERMGVEPPRHPLPSLFPKKNAEDFGFKHIIYEKKNGIARVTINRPQVYNSYNLAALYEMVPRLMMWRWTTALEW